MKVSELKTGMTVELGNGSLYKVVRQHKTEAYGFQDVVLIGKNRGFLAGSLFREDLKRNSINGYSVAKVYKEPETGRLLEFDTDTPLIWERKTEVTELTMQEVADKFGVDVADLRIKE